MTDEELRQLVREAIVRHAGPGAPTVAREAVPRVHSSHVTFAFLRSGDEDGACVIEPSVRCNHCGYCLSFGH